MARAELKDILGRIRESAAKYKGRGITEQDTKNALIEPVLAALGWPKEDLDRVRAEYRPTSKYNPVDYALLTGGRPVMFVEAKALDVSIDEHRFIVQVLSYANVAGVDWALITNGYQWDLYSVFARVDAAQKRFFTTNVEATDFIEWMSWLTPGFLEGNGLERFWRLVVAERRVKDAITDLLRSRDDGLVQLLAGKTALAATDVALALQSLQFQFDGPSMNVRAELLSEDGAPSTASKPAIGRTELPMPPSAEPERRPTTSVQPAAPSRPAASGPTRRRSNRSADLLPPPPPGRRPRLLRIGSTTMEVSNWKDLWLKVIHYIHQHAPERYDQLFTDPAGAGRKGRYIDREESKLRVPLEIPGGFAEGNLSAAQIVRVSSRLLDLTGLTYHGAEYELVPTDQAAD